MKFWTGVTDNRWFQHLATLPDVDEVNFWHPKGRAPFSSLPEGTPFLFKLKSPHHHIAGGGFFIKFERLPLELAWEAFGQKNGAATFEQFSMLIRRARGSEHDGFTDIGCSILGSPFFFPRHAWIPLGEEFKGNIVSGKAFDTTNDAGAALWARVEHLIHRGSVHEAPPRDLPATYGQPALISPRRGQGAFRALVTNAYSRRCAITGESTLPVLEAAHIKPVASSGLNNTFNGILLRSDFHRLFDVGLVTVTPEHRVIVSGRIKEQWYNGKAYNDLHGRRLAVLPEDVVDRPKADFLRWHNDNVFEQRFMNSP